MFPLLIGLAQAQAPDSAEFTDTAHTLPKGDMVIYLFTPSAYAITDQLNAKTSLLGLLGGPNAEVEINLFDDSEQAFSLGVSAAAGWITHIQGANLLTYYTLGGQQGRRLNAAVMPGFLRDGTGSEAVYLGKLPLRLSVHQPIREKAQVAVYVNGDPLSTMQFGRLALSGGAEVSATQDRLRLAAGLMLINGQIIRDGLEEDFGDVSWIPAVFPLPILRVWGRL
jgi:hypothetical protein